MVPKLTERQMFRTQVANLPKVDTTIYLRTYDVINSLDRAATRSWWKKAFGRLRHVEATEAAESRRPIQARIPESETQNAKAARLMLTAQTIRAEASVVAFGRVDNAGRELALVRTIRDQNRTGRAQKETAVQTRRVSWMMLALLAVVTAGLTFVIIRLAQPSPAANPGSEPSRHPAIYFPARPDAASLRAIL